MDVVGHGVTEAQSLGLGRVALALMLTVGLAVAQGCATASSHRREAGEQRPQPARPLTPAEPSAEFVAKRVLAGLAAGDTQSLQELVVTKNEFCTRVFPELPSSKVQNVRCDFVWDMAMLNHAAGFEEVLGRHKGKRYDFVSLRFAKGVQRYPSFRVHKDPLVTIRDENGQQHEYPLFGDILEIDGQYKLFGFMID